MFENNCMKTNTIERATLLDDNLLEKPNSVYHVVQLGLGLGGF